MKRTTTLALCGLLSAAVLQDASGRKAPPLLLTLEVDGKRLPIQLDKPLNIDLNGRKTRLTLRAEPHRVFEFAGIRFHYPRYMAFAAERLAPKLDTFTIEGTSAIINIYQYVGMKHHEELRRRMVRTLAGKYSTDAPKEATVLELGGQKIRGTILTSTNADDHFRQSVYSFEHGEDVILLFLLDSTKSERSSDEFNQAIAMLRESFAFLKR